MTARSDSIRNNAEVKSLSTGFDKERERLHRSMLSAVSHDLKTPLASIIGSLEIHERLKDKLPREKRQMLITTALEEAYRLDTFISNILDMAKLEGKLVTTQPDTCEIGRVIDDCINRLGYKLKESELHINALNGPLLVETDPALLSRAVGLLLDNAVKYSGPSPSIFIDYGLLENGECYIRVGDNGPGIPPGSEETIFSKYTRIDKQDHQNAGTGLGLAICREVSSLLNGKIRVENRQNGGAAFTLSFNVSE